MARAFTCGRCGKVKSTDAARGPLPAICDPCKIATGVQVKVSHQGLPVTRPAIVRDPFNSTPGTAPIQLPAPAQVSSDGDLPPDRPAPGPGPMELQLKAELDAMQMINPTARTQSLLALQLARAADRTDPSDVKTMLAVGKELRAILEALNKVPTAGGDDDDDNPFGAVRAEIQHPAAL